MIGINTTYSYSAIRGESQVSIHHFRYHGTKIPLQTTVVCHMGADGILWYHLLLYHFVDDNLWLKGALGDGSKFGDRPTAEIIGVYVNGVLK